MRILQSKYQTVKKVLERSYFFEMGRLSLIAGTPRVKGCGFPLSLGARRFAHPEPIGVMPPG